MPRSLFWAVLQLRFHVLPQVPSCWRLRVRATSFGLLRRHAPSHWCLVMTMLASSPAPQSSIARLSPRSLPPHALLQQSYHCWTLVVSVKPESTRGHCHPIPPSRLASWRDPRALIRLEALGVGYFFSICYWTSSAHPAILHPLWFPDRASCPFASPTGMPTCGIAGHDARPSKPSQGLARI